MPDYKLPLYDEDGKEYATVLRKDGTFLTTKDGKYIWVASEDLGLVVATLIDRVVFAGDLNSPPPGPLLSNTRVTGWEETVTVSARNKAFVVRVGFKDGAAFSEIAEPMQAVAVVAEVVAADAALQQGDLFR